MNLPKRISLLMALAFIFAACASPPATEAPPVGAPTATAAPSAPAVLRVGWAGSPDTLNPGTAILTEAYTIFELVYDSMYQLGLDGNYSLELAESVDVSDDGKVWTFHIREGIQFHDGQPLTAEDVAFSYNFYQTNEDFPFLNVYTSYFESVEATDAQTVVITLSEAIPNMESQLIFLYILPRHVWESEIPAEFQNVATIGSGPFQMKEYGANQFVHLVANKNHYLNVPKIDEIVFQTFENQDALVQAIRTGQVDMITEMPNTAVVSLRNAPNVSVVTGPSFYPSVADIIFNQTKPENCPTEEEGGICTGHPALLDRQVRLALSHATDKQQIIDVVLLGLGDPGLTLIPNGLGVFYNDSLKDYEYNVTLAKQILDQAGYADANGDGIREMPDGSNPLNLRMNYPSDSTNAPRMAELLKDMWSQVGVGVTIQALDPDALTSICCPAFDFDVILWGWGSDPDPGFLLSVMLTEEIPTGNSETGYSNPEYDALYLQQATELDDTRRIEIVWEMQRIVFDDVVYIIPFYEQNVQAYRSDRFTGWKTEGDKLDLSDISSLIAIEPVR